MSAVANEMQMKGHSLIAFAALAAALASGDGLAQKEKSLVTTRLEVTGEVSRNLSLSVEDLRAFAQRKGQALSLIHI